MFQRDYFMRMIGQMTEAVGQIMQLKREMKHDEALLIIDELLDKRFGLSGKLIRSLSDKDLIGVMTTNGVVETDNLQAIAVLMKQEAELLEAQGKEEASFIHYLKSLHLFMRLSLLGAAPTLVEPAKEAEQLLDKLKLYELPEETKLLRAEWHEGESQFDQADNVLHELLEDGAIPKEEVVDFYRRLLLYDDEKLLSGGLSREELEQGVEELAAKTQQ
ncbi:DUF6483 family protein [Paenibacillus radicis (ex Gao et al. 2016)]|uniref:Uncharacterized protein n=1 Tax=Paenibacillus radicis (ex Gao et al. 2016) TaxID=1737354 RepID=A0A917HLP6_9BACL|nr:DUF6483 family protein [Paenibacillus radicis (ex Gao et al. 2016)]GGG82428.1 hypothetical protein GCM10010918_44750 [Paenibacillus radicis (ex Gao et al. 2016)]